MSFMSRFTFTFQASAEGVFFAGYSTMKVILPRQDQLKEECSTESQVRNYWENLLYNSKNTIISVPEWYLEKSEIRFLSKTQSMQTCTFPLNTEKFGTMWSKGSLATLRHQDFQYVKLWFNAGTFSSTSKKFFMDMCLSTTYFL